MAADPIQLPEVEFDAGIPRVIHRVFLPGVSALPAPLAEELAALAARNPGWEQRVYDATAAEAYILAHYGPAMRALYDAIDPAYYAARADLFRYLVTYLEGGVYLDVKSTGLLPLDTVLRSDDAYLLAGWPMLRDLPRHRSSPHKELRRAGASEYMQWMIVASQGHPFLREVIERVVANLTGYRTFRDGVALGGVWRTTGPIPYTLAIAPIRDRYPHREVRIEDIGFSYTFLPDHEAHRTVTKQHYSRVHRPLMRRGRVETLAAQAWFVPLRAAKGWWVSRRGWLPR